jgi:O-antigen/teichoic acid export membrane protein
MHRIWNEWRRIRSSSMAHNAGWMVAGQAANYLLQAIYFVMLARLLGALEYGIFAGAFAFVNLTARYGTLGTGTVLMRYVSIDKNKFSLYWGNTLLVTTCGGLIMAAILYLVGGRILNPASAAVVLLAALANCLGTQIATCAAQVFQATEQMRITALLNLLTNLMRTAAAGVLLLLYHRSNAWQWAVISTFVSLIGSVLAVGVIAFRLGWPGFSLNLLRQRFVEGFGYAFANSTSSAYNDLDKAMLSHYGMNAANGIYTLAYRAVDIATIPVYALVAAAMPRLFRTGVGADGLSEAGAMAGRLWIRTFFVSLAAAAGLFLLSPLVPRFAGRSFAGTAEAMRWLCLIPVFRSAHEIAGAALMGAGLQRYRTASQVLAVVLNLLLNLWLIPSYSWQGAACSSLATDGVLGALSWTVLRALVLKSRSRTSCQLISSFK